LGFVFSTQPTSSGWGKPVLRARLRRPPSESRGGAEALAKGSEESPVEQRVPTTRFLALLRMTPILLGMTLVLLCGCNRIGDGTPDVDIGPLFAERDVEGAFCLYDPEDDRTITYNPDRCGERFLPASTFKVVNALVALETGVVAGPDEAIAWDGVDRGYASWNRDHTLATAMEHSVVWYYQEVARRIGRERMQHYVDLIGYGNQDISGAIDSFWLDGGLRISALEQIELLQRLYEGELPFSERSMDIVREMIVLEEGEGYRLSGKTGWTSRVESHIGWFVGYLEVGDRVYFFATNVEREESSESLGWISREITEQVLREMGLLPGTGVEGADDG
jgi:beta-lactamase class D